ncbi:hypothetical protein AAHB62_15870 [Bacillus cereus]
MKDFRVSEEEIQQARYVCREFILEALKEAKKTLFRITKSKRSTQYSIVKVKG